MNNEELVKFIDKLRDDLQILSYAICTHKWVQVNYNGYKTFGCCSCGKVSSDKK